MQSRFKRYDHMSHAQRKTAPYNKRSHVITRGQMLKKQSHNVKCVYILRSLVIRCDYISLYTSCPINIKNNLNRPYTGDDVKMIVAELRLSKTANFFL